MNRNNSESLEIEDINYLTIKMVTLCNFTQGKSIRSMEGLLLQFQAILTCFGLVTAKQLSHALPKASPSLFSCRGFATNGQLSNVLMIPEVHINR